MPNTNAIDIYKYENNNIRVEGANAELSRNGGVEFNFMSPLVVELLFAVEIRTNRKRSDRRLTVFIALFKRFSNKTKAPR